MTTTARHRIAPRPSAPARVMRAAGYQLGALIDWTVRLVDRLENTRPARFGCWLAAFGVAAGWSLVAVGWALVDLLVRAF